MAVNPYNPKRHLMVGTDENGDFFMVDKALQSERRALWDKNKKNAKAQVVINAAMKRKGLNPEDFEPVQEPAPRSRNLQKVWISKRRPEEEKPAPQPVPEELFAKADAHVPEPEEPSAPATKKKAKRSRRTKVSS